MTTWIGRYPGAYPRVGMYRDSCLLWLIQKKRDLFWFIFWSNVHPILLFAHVCLLGREEGGGGIKMHIGKKKTKTVKYSSSSEFELPT